MNWWGSVNLTEQAGRYAPKIREVAAGLQDGSLDQSQPTALRFRTHQDALDFARHGTDDSNRIFRALEFDIAKRYQKSEVYIDLRVTAGADAHEYDLIFRAVPLKGFGNSDRSGDWSVESGTECNTIEPRNDPAGGKGCVNRITHLVHGPEGVIPSLVWLEPAKERHNVLGDVFADATLEKIFQVVGASCDWKSSFSRLSFSGSDSGCVSGLIETGAEGQERFGGDILADGGKTVCKLNAEYFCNAVRIQVFAFGVWVLFDERCYDFFKPSNPIVCAV
jgi:hypothetical protein